MKKTTDQKKQIVMGQIAKSRQIPNQAKMSRTIPNQKPMATSLPARKTPELLRGVRRDDPQYGIPYKDAVPSNKPGIFGTPYSFMGSVDQNRTKRERAQSLTKQIGKVKSAPKAAPEDISRFKNLNTSKLR